MLLILGLHNHNFGRVIALSEVVYGSVPTEPPQLGYSAASAAAAQGSMKNHILKALPSKEYRIISPHLKPLLLPKDAVLYEAGERISDVYFPEDSMISYLSGTADGETLEVSVIGSEGVAGVTSLLGETMAFNAVVQIPGQAYAMKREVLRREFKRCEGLHRVLLQYLNALLVQVAQTAVCNKFHSVEQRFCGRLLMAHDRVEDDVLPMTQEALGRVLGSRRASISVVAAGFQEKGAIRYSRGVIHVLNRKYLESASCECYETISAAYSKVDS